MEMAMGPDHRHGTGTMTLVKRLWTAVEKLEQERQLLSDPVGTETMVLATLLGHTVDGSSAALAKQPDIGHGTLLAAMVMMPCTDHDIVSAAQATLLCIGRGIVVVVQGTQPCGCSAALEALGTQLEHAAGNVSAAQASVRDCASRVLTVPAIRRGRWAVGLEQDEATRRVDSRVPWWWERAMGTRGFRSTISSWRNRATSLS
jgi:hypothetical protein